MAKEIKNVRFFVMEDGHAVPEEELDPKEVQRAQKKAAEKLYESFGYVKVSNNQTTSTA